MNTTVQFPIYLAVLLAAVICCIYRFPQLDNAAKFIGLFLLSTLLSEGTSFYMAWKYHNNMPVYHVAAPVHFLLICLYFNSWLDVLRKKNIGLYLGIMGIPLAIANTLWLQPLNTFNSYFLLFEGACIISMALLAFYRLLDNERVRIMRYPHFWFSYIFLFFWSLTYVNWAMYKLLGEKVRHAMPFIGTLLWFVNVATYACLGAVIFLYPAKNSKA
jgi:hypothetical protein